MKSVYYCVVSNSIRICVFTFFMSSLDVMYEFSSEFVWMCDFRNVSLHGMGGCMPLLHANVSYALSAKIKNSLHMATHTRLESWKVYLFVLKRLESCLQKDVESPLAGKLVSMLVLTITCV